MKPMGCLIFGVICVVAFCWAIFQLGPALALMLMTFFGLGDSAVPVAFLLAGAFVIWCIVRGLRGG